MLKVTLYTIQILTVHISFKNLLFFFSISLIIEGLQFVFRLGAFDITDTITNTLGGVIGLMLFSKLYSPLSYILQIFQLKISRYNEYQADEFAVAKGNGELLCNGLKKLFKENSGDMDPDPVYAAFHYTHPTFVERLTYIKSIDKKEQ